MIMPNREDVYIGSMAINTHASSMLTGSIDTRSSEPKMESQDSNINSPAVTFEISEDGLAALSTSRTSLFSVNTTIKESMHYLIDAMDMTKDFYNNYDMSSDSDIYTQGRDIKNIIDTMWQKNTGTHNYSPSDWSQHGQIINGRRTVTEGPKDVQLAMTSLFNDLDFTTKKGIDKSYSIMRSAYNAMSTSI